MNRRRPTAVLFDLGNTLASYYYAEQFQPVLEAGVRNGLDELRRRELAPIDVITAVDTARTLNREAADLSVCPLAERLRQVFALGATVDDELIAALCERFLAPIFALGRRAEDALPTLANLRAAGFSTAIVSNTPWGSPAHLWRAELARLGLLEAVDATVFCVDVGWRKPARVIFEHAAERLSVGADACCFVGDDLQWDVEGAVAAGMNAVLLDRDERYPGYTGAKARDLWDVVRWIEREA